MILRGRVRAGLVVIDVDFQKLMAELPTLSVPQLAALDAAVKARMTSGPTQSGPTQSSGPPPGPPIHEPPREPAAPTPVAGCASIADIETRFAAAPVSPHCHAGGVVKWGAANRLRRYRCKACKLTFNALTETLFGHLPITGGGIEFLAQYFVGLGFLFVWSRQHDDVVRQMIVGGAVDGWSGCFHGRAFDRGFLRNIRHPLLRVGGFVLDLVGFLHPLGRIDRALLAPHLIL